MGLLEIEGMDEDDWKVGARVRRKVGEVLVRTVGWKDGVLDRFVGKRVAIVGAVVTGFLEGLHVDGERVVNMDGFLEGFAMGLNVVERIVGHRVGLVEGEVDGRRDTGLIDGLQVG